MSRLPHNAGLAAPVEFRELDDIEKIRKGVLDGVTRALTEFEPVQYGQHTLALSDVRVGKPPDLSYKAHKKAILSRGSVGTPIYGTWTLSGPDGVLDQKKKLLAHVPAMTKNGTYLRRGIEYTLASQQRMRHGIFTHRKANEQIESHFNVKPGSGKQFRLQLSPDTGKLFMHAGQANIPIVPVLRAIGADENRIKKMLGDELYEANVAKLRTDVVPKALKAFGVVRQPDDERDASELLAEYIAGLELDPHAVSHTLIGKPYDRVTPDSIFDAVTQIFALNKHEVDPDNRDSLIFQRVFSHEDLFPERVARDSGRVIRSLMWKLSRRGNLNTMPAGIFNKHLDQVLLGSGLGQPPEETNPTEIADQLMRVVRLGEGAIPSVQAVPAEARAVQASYAGWIDPIRSPECFDGETEVFTKRGWVSWSEVKDSDLFACQVSGRLEFAPAFRVIRKYYRGSMLHVSTRRASSSAPTLDFLVTPGHRIWTQPEHTGDARWKFEFAEEHLIAGGRRYQAKCKPWLGADIPRFTLPDIEIIGNNTRTFPSIEMGDWAEFMGWYLSEGSLYINREKGLYTTKISQSRAANPVKWQQIVDLLSKLPFASCNDDRGFTITGKQLAVYLEQFGKCTDKWIPAELLNSSIECRERLLDALMKGDGRTAGPSNSVSYITTSRRLADDVEWLMISLGRSTKRGIEVDNRETTTTTNYRVSMLVHDVKVSHKRDRAMVPFTGIVYCATVYGGLLLVRRNGSVPTWSGNSAKVGVDNRFTHGVLKGSDGQIYTKMLNAKTGKEETISSDQSGDSVVAFPGEWEQTDDDRVVAVVRGQVRRVPRSQVDYIIPRPEQLFTMQSNLMPGISAVSGGRVFLGAKFISQALPLINREAPLVQAESPVADTTFEDIIGRKIGTVASDVDGYVTNVTDDEIEVSGPGGVKTHSIANFLPYNRRTYLKHMPRVAVGDQVKAGDLLAVSNMTDSKGTLALGTNLSVAYVPFSRGGGSVSGETHVLWYDSGGLPRYTEIREANPSAAISVDTHAMNAGQLKVKKLWSHPTTRLLKVTTSSGRQLLATPDHSFIELGDDGRLVEVTTEQLRQGESFIPRLGRIDLPITQSNVTIPGSITKPKLNINLDFDLGFILGMAAAEGNVNRSRDKGRVRDKAFTFAVTDMVLRDAIISRLNRVWPHASVTDNQKYPYVRLFCTRVSTWLASVVGHLSHNKKVPDFIFGSPHDCRRGFVAGFWAGDGRVRRTRNVPSDTDTLTTSRLLRDGLGLLLASLGISTTHGEYLDRAYSRGVVYRLGVSCRDAHLMPEFEHTDKWAALERLIKSYKGSGIADHVPLFSKAASAYRKTVNKGSQTKKDKQYSRVKRQSYHRTANRGDILAVVPPDVQDQSLLRLRTLAESPLEWDTVKKVEEVEVDGPVYDLDMRPLRTFVCIDTLVVHNSNYEDAIVLSESGAKKLVAEQMYTKRLDKHEGSPDKSKFRAIFPGEYDKRQMDSIDDSGLVKPGTKLQFGDPVVLSVRRRPGKKAGMGGKSSKRRHVDTSIKWDHEAPGYVTDSAIGPHGALVAVRVENPLNVGDKMAGRYGDKHIVSAIVPDGQMPTNEEGEPFDAMVNPLGIISRGNPAQLVEAALGRIAKQTGVRQSLAAFDQGDMTADALRMLKEFNLKPVQSIMDPVLNKKIKGIAAGHRFYMRLHHLAEGKVTGRSEAGAFTQEGIPAKGGGESAPRLGLMEVNALLSAGATKVLDDSHQVRSSRNEDYWRAIRMGFSPPAPKSPELVGKFLSLLASAGVHVNQEGSRLNVMAMTDKQVDDIAHGEITTAETVRFPSLEPIKGGLFDRGITGGHGGTRFGRIDFGFKIPNPVMEIPIRRVLDLTENELREVLAGRGQLNSKTGPKAIQLALQRINVPQEIAYLQQRVKTARRTPRDAAIKKLRIMQMLQSTGLKPTDMLISKLPVLPPTFRPISMMSNNVPIVNSSNMLYKDLLQSKKNYNLLSEQLGDENAGDELLAVYDAAKAVVGLGDPVNRETQSRRAKGLLRVIFGDSPKMGLFQRKMMSKAVNLGGRAVITPDPRLNMDQVGIPEAIAWKSYSPFVMRRLVRRGMKPLEAAKRIKARSPDALSELQKEMSSRPVMINRAPSLHRYNLMGAWPVLVKSDSIHISPVTTPAFNADFDGDAMAVHVPATDEARKEVIEKLMPSKQLLHVSNFRSHFLPRQEYQLGLFEATRPSKKKTSQIFTSLEDAIAAFKRGELDLDAVIEVKGAESVSSEVLTQMKGLIS